MCARKPTPDDPAEASPPARRRTNGRRSRMARSAHDDHAAEVQSGNHRAAKIQKRPRVTREAEGRLWLNHVRRGEPDPRGVVGGPGRQGRASACRRQLEAVRRPEIAGTIPSQPVFRMSAKGLLHRSRAAGEHHRELVEHHVVRTDGRSARQVEDDRILRSEGIVEHRVEAIDDPAMPEVVVHDEHATRTEAAADVGERLCREEVALEPDIAVAAVEHEGIDERIHDQVGTASLSSAGSSGRHPDVQ